MPVVVFEKCSKSFSSFSNNILALNNVSFEVDKGEFLSIMGPSGSGKSTLLYCLATLDKITSGDILINNRSVVNLSDKQLTQIRCHEIGFIFQSFNLVPTLTAQENITLPLTLAKRRLDTKTKDFLKQLVKVLGIEDRLKHLPGQLSGGQQQRVAVARALLSRPQIILADEPTGNLDTKTGKELILFLKQASKTYKQTIIMVTHDANVASHTQRTLFLKDGAIIDELKQPSLTKILNRLNKF